MYTHTLSSVQGLVDLFLFLFVLFFICLLCFGFMFWGGLFVLFWGFVCFLLEEITYE